MAIDKNSLLFWFPKVRDRGLPVPRTRMVRAPEGCDLQLLLDGREPKDFAIFQTSIEDAVRDIGTPCFLRTGHGSGKHDWVNTCYVTDVDLVLHHVAALVEWSALVDIMGLPTSDWAVREMIETFPLFYAFRDMPITREFRVFARDLEIEAVLPYWPPGAIQNPDRDDWQACLFEASEIFLAEQDLLEDLALAAVDAVGGGYWSVDFLQASDGRWFLTDMADGDRSYKWSDERLGKYDQVLGDR